jgi:hypothetical protein
VTGARHAGDEDVADPPRMVAEHRLPGNRVAQIHDHDPGSGCVRVSVDVPRCGRRVELWMDSPESRQRRGDVRAHVATGDGKTMRVQGERLDAMSSATITVAISETYTARRDGRTLLSRGLVTPN